MEGRRVKTRMTSAETEQTLRPSSKPPPTDPKSGKQRATTLQYEIGTAVKLDSKTQPNKQPQIPKPSPPNNRTTNNAIHIQDNNPKYKRDRKSNQTPYAGRVHKTA